MTIISKVTIKGDHGTSGPGDVVPDLDEETLTRFLANGWVTVLDAPAETAVDPVAEVAATQTKRTRK